MRYLILILILAQVINADLLLHYDMNGNTNNVAGNGYDATPVNVQYGAGVEGSALELLDGKGYAICSDPLTLSTFSLSVWFNTLGIDTSNGPIVSNEYYIESQKQYFFEVWFNFPDLLYIEYYHYQTYAGWTTKGAEKITIRKDFSEGWHNVVLTVDNSMTFTIDDVSGDTNWIWLEQAAYPVFSVYTDGVQDTSYSHDSPLWMTWITTDQPLYIGNSPIHIQSYSGFEGSIDEVRIYDSCLTQGDVESLYESFKLPTVTSTTIDYRIKKESYLAGTFDLLGKKLLRKPIGIYLQKGYTVKRLLRTK